MTLFIDPTGETFFAALVSPGRFFSSERAWTRDAHALQLSTIHQIVQRAGVTPASVKKIVVVRGPGRYSALRVAAVIANAFHFVTGPALAVRIGTTFQREEKHIRALVRSARSVSTVRPHYGQPPKVTKAKPAPKAHITRKHR